MHNTKIVDLTAVLQSWTTTNNLPLVRDSLDESWKSSESWKLVQSAEKEMYRKMHIDSKNDNQENDGASINNKKIESDIQDKITKLQSMQNVTQQGSLFSTSKYSDGSR